MQGKKKKPVTLDILLSTVDIEARSCTEASCRVDSFEAARKLFESFLHDHGTNFNDFDEFHCRFVDDKSEKGDKNG